MYSRPWHQMQLSGQLRASSYLAQGKCATHNYLIGDSVQPTVSLDVAGDRNIQDATRN